MPRDPNNNPTERIGRILDDVDDLESYIQELHALIPESRSLPQYPILEAIIPERAVRHRVLGQIYANRRNKRNSREKLERGYRVRARGSFQDHDIMGEVDRQHREDHGPTFEDYRGGGAFEAMKAASVKAMEKQQEEERQRNKELAKKFDSKVPAFEPEVAAEHKDKSDPKPHSGA